MHTAAYPRDENENWHYDKYKDPHEFPNLDFANDADSNTTVSSINISKKLPKISDEKFKRILEIRKNSNNRKKPISSVQPPTVTDTPESDLLSASTPKLTNTVDIDESKVSTSKKNISPLLLQSDHDDDDINSNNNHQEIEKLQSKTNELDKLLELLKEQAIQINQLESDLTKKDILIKNYENNTIILENQTEKLNNKLSNNESEILELNSKIGILENSNLKNNDLINKLEYELKKEKSLIKKELDLHKKTLIDYDSNYERLKIENNKFKSEIETKKTEIDSLKDQNNLLSNDTLKLKTQVDTLIQIRDESLNISKRENDALKLENQKLILESKSLVNSYEEKLKNIIGYELKEITYDTFKDKGRYDYLEMNKIDLISLTECRNILKNIVNFLDIKYSDIRPFIAFIRDDVFKFFNDIHSILHCKESGKSFYIDSTIRLHLVDYVKVKACMDLLIHDVKKLKGVQ